MGSADGGGPGSIGTGLYSNIIGVSSSYAIDGLGKFGEAGETKNSQQIFSNSPRKAASRLFNKLAEGAVLEYLPGKPGEVKVPKERKGQIAKFKDGSHVIFRPKSSHKPTHSPVLEIILVSPSRPRQKIHFEHISLKEKSK